MTDSRLAADGAKRWSLGFLRGGSGELERSDVPEGGASRPSMLKSMLERQAQMSDTQAVMGSLSW